jgi:hypothetical protein
MALGRAGGTSKQQRKRRVYGGAIVFPHGKQGGGAAVGASMTDDFPPALGLVLPSFPMK